MTDERMFAHENGVEKASDPSRAADAQRAEIRLTNYVRELLAQRRERLAADGDPRQRPVRHPHPRPSS